MSVPSTKAQSVHGQGLNLLDLLIVLAKHRWLILCITAACIVAAIALAFILPNRFTAETVVLPPAQGTSSGLAMLGQMAGADSLASLASSGLGGKSIGEMYMALLQSRTVEDAMVNRFKLIDRYHAKNATDARKALTGHTALSLNAKDGLITLRMTDKDPRQAAAFANGYVEELHNLTANLAITEAARRRAFFQQQMLEANQNLATAEDAMKKTEQTTGVFQIDSQTSALVQSAAALRAQIAAKEVQLQSMRTYATDNNPDILGVRQQLSALQGQLAQLTGSGKDSSANDLLLPKGKIPEAGLEYIRRLRDVKYYETISALLARQFELAKVDEAREGNSVQVVDAAVPPEHRSFPKPLLMIPSAAAFGLFVGCVWSLLLEGWNRLKTNPDNSGRLAVLRSVLR